MQLVFLSAGDALKKFRKEQYDKQGGVCPILKQVVPFEETVVDHLHGTKSEIAGVNNAHMVRGIIHNYANACEGKFLSRFKRSGLSKFITFTDFLRNLADYLDSPPLFGSGFVHPDGKPQKQEFGKREYARVIKYWSVMYPKRKQPEWKEKLKRGKPTGRMNLTKNWEKWISEANAIHYKKYN